MSSAGTPRRLEQTVSAWAVRAPDAPAVVAGDGTMTYRELEAAAAGVAAVLRRLGVRRGDRVAIASGKCCRTVAAMIGVLRAGAACVPIHPWTPRRRALAIVDDCAPAAVVADDAWGSDGKGPPVLATADEAPGAAAAWRDIRAAAQPAAACEAGETGDLALLLYTSGSTGRPKGVCISHENALAFVAWAVRLVAASPRDRFANHAPFQFDLSVFDLYGAFYAGARTVLVPESSSYSPESIVRLIESEKITIWYSVPSALIHMMEHGRLLGLDPSPLRAVLFAGEVFPIRQLRLLRRRWPALRLVNFYGPTETNVCTWFEVGEIPEERTRPVPIGAAACGDRVWAVTEAGRPALPGETGELLVTGPTVMLGYWGHPPRMDAPHRTGDFVRVLEDGTFEFVGRRDHMVKLRGYRVEPGEIEAALAEHPAIREAAVVVRGAGADARVIAFALASDPSPSLLELKRHCAARLPRYITVDELRVVQELPRTDNGKIDRVRLAELRHDAARPET